MNKVSFLWKKNFLFLSSLPVFTGFFVLPPLNVDLVEVSPSLESGHIQVSSTVELLLPEFSLPVIENIKELSSSDQNAEARVVLDENNSVAQAQEFVAEEIPEMIQEEMVNPPVQPQEEVLNFFNSRIVKMKAIDPAYVAVLITNAFGEPEVWFYDFYNYVQRDVGEKIGTPNQIMQNSPLGAKGRFFFWRGQNTMFAYDAVAQKLHSKEFQGENARLCFEECAFDIILRNNEFYFYSQQTGEIFSDDDSALRWQLYDAHLRNLPASREDLVEQNFTVSQE